MNDKYFSRDNLEMVIEGLKVSLKPDKPDWNQNDKSATDYIENKPFYSEYVVIVDHYTGNGSSPKCNFIAGNTYDVIWNGRTYKGLVCHTDGEYNFIGGGEYPFYIDDDGGDGFYVEPESGFTVSILEDIVHHLDEKYIPDSIARANDVSEILDEVSEILDEVSETLDEVVGSVNSSVAGKMETNNPVGTGSFSMNRKSGTTVGSYSVATGVGTTASGYASHAEGTSTTASGEMSHAEGYDTNASGYCSHTEGYRTTASGNYSHVQGQYNIKDTENKYAHIVGNGTGIKDSSNAHTVDWHGVGWFQGGLQVGGNAQDDGAKTVLLEGDAIPVPETAEVGQVMRVKSVDENGKPVEWETTDISTSDGSGCVVSDTAPEDTSVLWIDTSDNSAEEVPGGSVGGNIDLGITGSTVGQTVKISAVDENGVPTAWEPTDFPSGGGSEEIWEDVCDITIEEDVFVQHLLSGAENKCYKKLEIAIANNAGAVASIRMDHGMGTMPDSAQPSYAILWSPSNQFGRASVYPVDNSYFGIEYHANGAAYGWNAEGPVSRAPAYPPLNGNGENDRFRRYYASGGINRISVYAKTAGGVLAKGTNIIIRGVRF